MNLDGNMVLERRDDCAFRTIGDETVILSLDSGIYYSLNEIGSQVWNRCNGSCNLTAVAKALCEEYEVTEDISLRDVLDLTQDLLREGLFRVKE